jgi:hypothetical protein
LLLVLAVVSCGSTARPADPGPGPAAADGPVAPDAGVPAPDCGDLATSVNNCGACGHVCPSAPRATVGCAAGACRVDRCQEPYGDCDGEADNGCEVDTRTSTAHCGGCGRRCAAAANGVVGCVAGRCAVTCDKAFGDCDGNFENGCETSLDDPRHCGACDTACQRGFVCSAGACQLTPAALDGLVVWLDAAAGVTTEAVGGVSRWQDQSPSHNDAVQGVSASQPVVTPNAANGRPIITFGAARNVFLRIPDHPTLQWGSGDFTVLLVARGLNAPPDVNYGALFHKQAQTFPFVGPSLWLDFPFPTPATALGVQLSYGIVYVVSKQVGINDGRLRLLGMRRSGRKLEARIDGVLSGVTGNADIDVSVPGNDVFIGSHGIDPSIQQLDGGIAEVVAVRGPLADVDLARLEAFLKTKYGLP